MELSSGYSISSDRSRLDFDRIHPWLAGTYWSPGISRSKVERAALNSSLVVGAYFGDEQVAYLRIISDKETFAWVADVFVAEEHRGKGLAQAMVRLAQADADHQGMRRWVLATRDAHSTYAKCGFDALPEPDRWMIYFPDDWLVAE
jgi:GNAT superfamily N-acetyltransferase